MTATNTDLRTALGQRIRHARTNAGLTTDQLADRVGVTRGAVSQWEAGIAAPAADKQLKLASALRLDWADLFRPSTRKTTRR